MPRPPNALVRAAICLGLIVAAAWTGLTACTDAGGYGLISLTVTGSGTGAGIVSSNDPGVDIQCAFPATAGCTDTFPDAAGGGGFNLIATPSTGSVFGAWTGCDLTSPGVCSLAFPASSGNTDYVVSVRFDLATTNTVTLYNATAGSAFLTLETESPRGTIWWRRTSRAM